LKELRKLGLGPRRIGQGGTKLLLQCGCDYHTPKGKGLRRAHNGRLASIPKNKRRVTLHEENKRGMVNPSENDPKLKRGRDGGPVALSFVGEFKKRNIFYFHKR